MQLVAAQLAMRGSLYALNVKMPFELISPPRDEVTFSGKGEAFWGFVIFMNLKMLFDLKVFRNGTKVCGVTSCGGDRYYWYTGGKTEKTSTHRLFWANFR